MKVHTSELAALLCLAATPAFAQSWTGFLVDSNCYESVERNVNPWDTNPYVDRDRDWEVRYCSPNGKTKSFTLVDHDGINFRLDASGNARAAELLRGTRKKSLLEVTVTGEKNKNAIRVDSISLAK